MEYLGKTAWGRPLLCRKGGQGARRVLFCAAHHGSEWITTLVLLRFWRQFRARKDWQRACTLYCVPCVNPDGAALARGQVGRFTPLYLAARGAARQDPELVFPAGWKANGRGVDLNLNYPAGWQQAVRQKGKTEPAAWHWPGPKCASEIETRAMMALCRRVRPQLLVTLHAQGREIYWEYGGFAPSGAREVGEIMAARSGYALRQVPPSAAFGGMKDWFLIEFAKPAYPVECGLGVNPLPLSQLPEICRQVFPILETALLGV